MRSDRDVYHLDLPVKDRVNRLLRHNDVEKQPISTVVYDIIKWIEVAEKAKDNEIEKLEAALAEAIERRDLAEADNDMLRDTSLLCETNTRLEREAAESAEEDALIMAERKRNLGGLRSALKEINVLHDYYCKVSDERSVNGVAVLLGELLKESEKWPLEKKS